MKFAVYLLSILSIASSLVCRVSEPFYYHNCENLQAICRGPWKLHLPRSKEQLPFWDKNKAFANLQKPVLYNQRTDKSESTNLGAGHPEIVQEMMALAESVRQDVGEFMQRGRSQRPTGSLFPTQPVISHEKDWGTVDLAVLEAIAREHQKRHQNQNRKKARPRRRKQQ